MGGGGERDDVDVCDARAARLRVVLDLVLLLVELSPAEEIVDGLVVLIDATFLASYGDNAVNLITHNFEELALHLVGPALTLQLVGDLKHLLYRPWDHSYSQIGLALR